MRPRNLVVHRLFGSSCVGGAKRGQKAVMLHLCPGGDADVKHQPEDVQMHVLAGRRLARHLVACNLRDGIVKTRRLGKPGIASVAVQRGAAVMHLRRRDPDPGQSGGRHAPRGMARALWLQQQRRGGTGRVPRSGVFSAPGMRGAEGRRRSASLARAAIGGSPLLSGCESQRNRGPDDNRRENGPSDSVREDPRRGFPSPDDWLRRPTADGVGGGKPHRGGSWRAFA